MPCWIFLQLSRVQFMWSATRFTITQSPYLSRLRKTLVVSVPILSRHVLEKGLMITKVIVHLKGDEGGIRYGPIIAMHNSSSGGAILQNIWVTEGKHECKFCPYPHENFPPFPPGGYRDIPRILQYSLSSWSCCTKDLKSDRKRRFCLILLS